MIKMTFSTKWTVEIVENPVIVEKILLLKQCTIARFYCIWDCYSFLDHFVAIVKKIGVGTSQKLDKKQTCMEW